MNAIADEDPDGPKADRPLDAFLLYNEREKRADWVAARLREAGLAIHFFRSDIAVGDSFRHEERDRLRRAGSVVVLLGASGWGPSQLELLALATEQSKRLLPVLVGRASKADLEQGDGLFRDRLYVDLSRDDPEAVRKLVDAIRGAAKVPPPRDSLRFDDLVGTLVDGNDGERAALLHQLINRGFVNASALAERLRQRIRTDFAPDQEKRSSAAVRAPERLPAIRSWMLSTVIWLDADHPDTRELVLSHVDSTYETDRFVRFWCLAGLIDRGVSYLDEALKAASADPEREVAYLAALAGSPEDERLLRVFERDLQAPDFEVVWRVLRVLRILPAPRLVRAVCDQLGRVLGDETATYDALFALANPKMAAAAHDLLLQSPGLERLTEMILSESRESNEIAKRRFAALLSTFDPAETRRALSAAAGDEESRQMARRIIGFMAEQRREEEGRELFIAGYSSDLIDVSHDDLGITRDVETLATVMLAREIVPPLAIGLFGPWGSGKSFFMKSIQAAIRRIVARREARRETRFCERVVDIEFNAWHYNDANLWASLVSHILDKLSSYVTPGTTAVQQEESLGEALGLSRTELAAAEAERIESRKALAEAEAELDTLRRKRENAQLGWRDLDAADLASLLEMEPDLRKDVEDALAAVGAPPALATAAELDRAVRSSFSVAGRVTALAIGLLRAPNRTLLWTCLLLVLAAPLIVGGLVHKFLATDLSLLAAVAAEFTVLAGAAVKLLDKGLPYVRSSLDTVSAARTRVEALLASKRQPPSVEEERLAATIVQSRAREEAAKARSAAAAARARELEQQVALLRESQSLGYFLSERTRSDDYRRHLGLVSIIRKDFETLVERLQPAVGPPVVERIILYIDDLDRCPSKMVIDVLQAVHLLLAYPLFVVVVSVDPRWLLRSLEASYSHFDPARSEGDEAWVTTPQDYLEKIFQIPFSVRPMGQTGFSRLMDRVLAVSAPDDAEQASGTPARRDDSPQPSSDEKEPPSAERKIVSAQPAARFEIVEEALVIRSWELAFASGLYDFIPTPRAAKRFANIYRILKAAVDRSQLARHEGTRELPGDFRLPMLLLAVVIGRPAEAARLFPEFLENAEAGRDQFWLGSGSARHSAEIEKVREEIGALASEPDFPRSAKLVADWLPRVARFSFVTAGIRRSGDPGAAGDDRRSKPPLSA